ncbi:4a-hydroxytetrahydrobiopterin dehydratase [Candidatus Gottesmanbacteria bacterium]|nr:4a-hydroxytetrahydrobiopterin dehydratase [Candidatus Gottesmanbacteria bacterium]
MNLTQKKCGPCEGGIAPFTSRQIKEYSILLNKDWEVIASRKISRLFKFKNFREAFDFVNKVAAIAEQEQHHPDITINYNRVLIDLTTHAIKGLSMNDFIMAAKIEVLKH